MVVTSVEIGHDRFEISHKETTNIITVTTNVNLLPSMVRFFLLDVRKQLVYFVANINKPN